MALRTPQYFKGGNLQGLALFCGRVGEGHRAVVVGTRFCCQQGDVVDAGDCLVDVAPALASDDLPPLSVLVEC
ncbi:MAG: hypothetical protein QF876_04850 [Desulfobacterales bacterium]|nr:hypothetical protein [Desulfobacterales bacterium]